MHFSLFMVMSRLHLDGRFNPPRTQRERRRRRIGRGARPNQPKEEEERVERRGSQEKLKE